MIDIHHLPGSQLNESRIQIYRKNVITLIPLILAAIVVLILPFALYAGVKFLNPEWFEVPGAFPAFVAVVSAFFLFTWLFVFMNFVEYWLDTFILTERRILSIDQSGLFNRTVSELRLYRIQDVTAEVKGIVQNIFNYGSIFIQTAGEIERFRFESISDPNRVAKMILEMSDQDRREHMDEAMEDMAARPMDRDRKLHTYA